MANLRETIKILEKHKRRPQRQEEEKYLAIWLDDQMKNYKTQKDIMKNEDIRKQFENLMAKFPTIFKTYMMKNEDIRKEFQLNSF